jgi:hypothetical protein
MGRPSYVCSSMRRASVGALGAIWVLTLGGFTIPVVTASNMHSSGCVGSSYGMVKSEWGIPADHGRGPFQVLDEGVEAVGWVLGLVNRCEERAMGMHDSLLYLFPSDCSSLHFLVIERGR